MFGRIFEEPRYDVPSNAHPPGGWPVLGRGVIDMTDDDFSIEDTRSGSAGTEPRGDAGEGHVSQIIPKKRLQPPARSHVSSPNCDRPPDDGDVEGSGYPDDVEDLALKLFSADRSIFGVCSEQRRNLVLGMVVESGDEVCCVAGTPLELSLNACDVFGERICNRTQLDIIASRLSTTVESTCQRNSLRVRPVPEAHFRREDEMIMGTLILGDPGNYRVTVNVELRGGEEQPLQPRGGVDISVLSRRG